MGFSTDHTILFYFLIYVRGESADATIYHMYALSVYVRIVF